MFPGCYRLRPGEGPETAGDFRFQDIGSQAVVPLLDLAPGHRFLDLCAAPGNKTAQALETQVRAIACDLHISRARLLSPLGIPVVTLDATQPLPFRREIRPDPGGRALFRHGHSGAQPGNQVASDFRRYRRSAEPSGGDPAKRAGSGRAGGAAGLLHMFART